MKNYILLIILICLIPTSTYAHGESPAMFVIIGYIFIVPLLIGVVDYYLLKHICNLRSNGMTKIIIYSFLITVFGYLLSFSIVDNLNIESDKLDLLLIMVILTIIQIVFKYYSYKWGIVEKKSNLAQVKKTIAGETLLLNIIFTLIVLILI